jgi:hypothetical protein
MSPDETPPLELAWYADGKTLVRVVRMLVHSDRLATSLAEATQKLAACGLPISDKFAEICRDADRWDELDEQLHALRSKTLELERRGKTDTLELNLQLFLENVAMHLWNERTKSIRFDIASGAWAASCLRDVLEKMPPDDAREIRDWFIRSLSEAATPGKYAP